MPSTAYTSDYSLTDKEVTLDGENDGEVEISLITAEGGTFYAFQADWTLSENESTEYFTLSDLTAGGDCSASSIYDNDPSSGSVYCEDMSGFEVSAGESVWTATYTIDADTPSGTYTVSLAVEAIVGGESINVVDENFTLTATITVKRADDPLTATFETDSGVSSIDIYYTQDYTTADEEDVTTAIARNSDTGLQDTSGSGQINFLVNLEDNYLIDSIAIDGGYKNIKDSDDTGVDNMYRITKITSDLTVTITTKERTSIVPEISGYDASYEYTGSSIQPEITVNIYGTATTLTEGTDYTVTYGTNTEIGTGKITISSISTSEYVFTDTIANFSIVEKTLTEDDVTVPTSITYTGSDLSPEVVVYTNGTTLEENTDYTVAYDNQGGAINEYVTVTVTGIGNYTGTVTKTVLITPKPSRDVTIEDLTLTYGDTKTYTDIEDCEVTYTSSDDTIVSVTHSYSSETSTNKLMAVSVGQAVITATYAETDDYAETTITFTVTVEQKELTITDIKVSDKIYDGTTDATVTDVEFDGVLSTDTLTLGTNYSVVGTFSSSSAGEDKTVTVIVTLLDETNTNYTLSSNTYYTTANITAIEIDEDDVTMEIASYTYDGTAKEPSISVEVDSSALAQNTDYTVTYTNNVDAGTATVTITSTGSNFTGTIIKTFSIIDKDVLTISGISDNQSIVYTGSAVVLEGTLAVSDNDNEITADDLTVVWYDESGNIIFQPTDVGSYMVTYSYSDTDYEGSLTINFEITKATSGTPSEVTDGLTAIVGQTLADVSLTTNGLYWVDETTEVLAGSNTYYATYTQNNDTTNYTTETVQITVYGKVYIDITTSVNGSGGSISDSIENVLEETSSTITFTPDEGYEIDNVTVNGTEVSVSDNTLTVTAGTVDLEVIVTYKVIQYTITIETTNAETDPSGTIYVDYNSEQSITITANDGYELSSILVNGTEMIDSLVDGVLTLSNITSDITIVVTAESSESDSSELATSDDSSDSTTSSSSLPDTGDNILKYTILFVVSAIGCLVSIKKIKDNK